MPLDPWNWLALFFLLALAGTWAARRYAVQRKLLDEPGARRSHQNATPRGGGLSIVIAMLVALIWLAGISPSSRGLLLAAALGLLLVSGVGWADDHRSMPAWSRLAMHLAAAGSLAAGLWWAGQGPWAALLALVAVPVLVNVWNFMDGIDGLAASQASIAACAYAMSSQDPVGVALSLGLFAACLGFLPFNFPRARIFLGDVGSGALGYLLACLVLWLMIRPGAAAGSGILLVLPISAFLVDASLTLGRRIVRGESWWTPHVQHAYQQQAFRLGAHWPVTMAYAIWSVLGSGLLLLLLDQAWAIKVISVFGWLLASSIAWLVMQNTRSARRPGQGTPE